jgi:hypothetical protein
VDARLASTDLKLQVHSALKTKATLVLLSAYGRLAGSARLGLVAWLELCVFGLDAFWRSETSTASRRFAGAFVSSAYSPFQVSTPEEPQPPGGPTQVKAYLEKLCRAPV